MANGSHTEQETAARVQSENRCLPRQVEDMPMKHHVHPIPRCREGGEDCRRIRELLECQIGLLEKILSVLDKGTQQKGT